MDYEEALKIAKSLIDNYQAISGYQEDNYGYLYELTRKIAEEIFNAFTFGTKW